MEKYKIYTPEDFLLDEDFIHWQLFHTEEDNVFWAKIIQTYPFQKKTIEQASADFKKTVKINKYPLNETRIDNEVSLLLQKLNAKKLQKKRRYLVTATSAAASLAILLISSFFLLTPKQPLVSESIKIKHVKIIPNDDVLLVMGDSSITLENNAQIQLDKQGLVILDHKSQVVKSEEIINRSTANKLIVPYGKRSSVILSDGSKLWVNSGTTVEYPTTFEGDTRNIKVEGEIYIEVAKDKQKQFIVSTPKFDVKVFGTTFNVSAYSQDKSSYVVLVEGKVSVNKEGCETSISPNELYKSTENTYTIEKVEVDDFISWRHGWLPIKSFSLSEVTQQLSRYYNIDIKCEPDIANLKSSGKLRLFDKIEDVLHVISNNMNIQYKQIDNSIVLYNPQK